MMKLNFSRFFRQATAFVMTVLCARSALLLGDLLTMPPGSGAFTSAPRRIESIAGGLILYLVAAVVTAEARAAREKS